MPAGADFNPLSNKKSSKVFEEGSEWHDEQGVKNLTPFSSSFLQPSNQSLFSADNFLWCQFNISCRCWEGNPSQLWGRAVHALKQSCCVNQRPCCPSLLPFTWAYLLFWELHPIYSHFKMLHTVYRHSCTVSPESILVLWSAVFDQTAQKIISPFPPFTALLNPNTLLSLCNLFNIIHLGDE